MKEITTAIDIDVKPEAVWKVLTDFEEYPEWNPFIRSISGEKVVGRRLSARIEPPEGRPMTFRPEVIKVDPGRELRWKGQLLIKGLFDGEHYFLLRENAGGSTRFVHGEQFSGILVGIFGRTLEKTKRGFNMMNAALKARCESMSG
jgi:hypothetical protein